MIALAMCYALAVGAVCGAAAWLLERAARLAGRPLRWAWAAALALSVALPRVALWRAARDAEPVTAIRTRVSLPRSSDGRAAAGPVVPRPTRAVRLPATLAAPAAWTVLDRPLLALWCTLSFVAMARLAVAACDGARALRRWAHVTIDGAPVRVSADVGPAVMGAWRAEVVVPAWALTDARLPVMLAHERAHVRARDPLLVVLGTFAAALAPWNPALWWQLGRLRAAVELDCDRRVLAALRAMPAANQRLSDGRLADERLTDVRAYGALLLDVAGRTPAPVSALALTARPTLLHRRIEAMTTPRPKRALLRAAVPAAAAAALAALACETPRPTSPRLLSPRPVAGVPITEIAPPADVAAANVGDGSGAAQDSRLTLTDVRAALATHAPDLLRTATGRARRVWVVQEADGRVSRLERAIDADLAAPVQVRGVRIAVAGARPGLTTLSGTPDLVASSRPGSLQAIDPAHVAAVDVLRLPPGRVTPDSLSVIWLRLRPVTSAVAPDRAPERPVLAGARAARISPDRVARPDTARSGDSGALTGPAPAPVYIVDGREVPPGADGSPGALPAADAIQSVNVLKGAQATALVGARGAAGVVQIITKAAAAKP